MVASLDGRADEETAVGALRPLGRTSLEESLADVLRESVAVASEPSVPSMTSVPPAPSVGPVLPAQSMLPAPFVPPTLGMPAQGMPAQSGPLATTVPAWRPEDDDILPQRRSRRRWR